MIVLLTSGKGIEYSVFLNHIELTEDNFGSCIILFFIFLFSKGVIHLIFLSGCSPIESPSKTREIKRNSEFGEKKELSE